MMMVADVVVMVYTVINGQILGLIASILMAVV